MHNASARNHMTSDANYIIFTSETPLYISLSNVITAGIVLRRASGLVSPDGTAVTDWTKSTTDKTVAAAGEVQDISQKPTPTLAAAEVAPRESIGERSVGVGSVAIDGPSFEAAAFADQPAVLQGYFSDSGPGNCFQVCFIYLYVYIYVSMYIYTC